jgi:hypothetical protein
MVTEHLVPPAIKLDMDTGSLDGIAPEVEDAPPDGGI